MPFPPETKEIQLDEKWSFVYKKQKNCSNDEKFMGDNWDHVAYDPEHKLVLQVVCGKRTIENTDELIKKTKERLNGEMPAIIASDEYKPYKKSILRHYGKTVQQQRKGMVGRLPKPIKVAPEGLNYVVVHKTRENGKVINIMPKIIFGTERSVAEVLGNSTVQLIASYLIC